MQIARDVAGFSLAEADNMRKAMERRSRKKMIQIKEKFVSGAVNNGVAKNIATEIFNLILDFADYGFNKSHELLIQYLHFTQHI